MIFSQREIGQAKEGNRFRDSSIDPSNHGIYHFPAFIE